jgi:ketosteroid isomerase-like protein
MSTQSVGVVRELYERFPDLAAAQPPPDLLDMFDPEVRLDQTRNVFNPAEFAGREGVLQALSRLRETWEQFVIEPERFVETGDHVVVIHTVRARGRAGGVEVVGRSATLHTMRAGRILRLAIYPDPDEALREVGLPAEQSKR